MDVGQTVMTKRYRAPDTDITMHALMPASSSTKNCCSLAPCKPPRSFARYSVAEIGVDSVCGMEQVHKG